VTLSLARTNLETSASLTPSAVLRPTPVPSTQVQSTSYTTTEQ
jgi:hypothetical protein